MLIAAFFLPKRSQREGGRGGARREGRITEIGREEEGGGREGEDAPNLVIHPVIIKIHHLRHLVNGRRDTALGHLIQDHVLGGRGVGRACVLGDILEGQRHEGAGELPKLPDRNLVKNLTGTVWGKREGWRDCERIGPCRAAGQRMETGIGEAGRGGGREGRRRWSGPYLLG